MTLEEKKVQIHGKVEKRVVPIDRLTKLLFSFEEEEYALIVADGEECGCREPGKGGKEIVTPFWLENIGEYKDLLPPDPFTRELFFALVSAYEEGYRVATFSMTLDALTGGEEKYRVYKEQFAAIKRAIDKLGFTQITVKLEPLLESYPKYKARCRVKEGKIVGALLPLKYMTAKVNGQEVLAVKLLDESPLMTVAKIKNQILPYDATPLAILGQHNTPRVIVLKNWLLRRIELMKRKHGALSTSILFDTLYAECGLANAGKVAKHNARKTITEILSAFRAEGVIRDFEIERQGQRYRALKITP